MTCRRQLLAADRLARFSSDAGSVIRLQNERHKVMRIVALTGLPYPAVRSTIDRFALIRPAGDPSWIALNRIDATGASSQISGHVKADGAVWLINPNFRGGRAKPIFQRKRSFAMVAPPPKPRSTNHTADGKGSALCCRAESHLLQIDAISECKECRQDQRTASNPPQALRFGLGDSGALEMQILLPKKNPVVVFAIGALQLSKECRAVH